MELNCDLEWDENDTEVSADVENKNNSTKFKGRHKRFDKNQIRIELLFQLGHANKRQKFHDCHSLNCFCNFQFVDNWINRQALR